MLAIVGEMMRTQLLSRGGGSEDGALADAVPDYSGLRALKKPDIKETSIRFEDFFKSNMA